MKFTAKREALLSPLQSVIGVVERRQTMPILANVLLSARKGKLSVTATDLEVELVAQGSVPLDEEGDVTVPGRKLLDICKALPDGAEIKVSHEKDRVSVRSGRSRFTLSTLPAGEFPVVDDIHAQQTLTLKTGDANQLLEKTHFAMAHQDVRYYLNGLLLEVDGQTLRAVATDGHRLALCEVGLESIDGSGEQVIVPRKGVLELQRLLQGDDSVTLAIGNNHVRAEVGDIRFTSKLIDGRFPEYSRVIPRGEGNVVTADRGALRQALQRTAILSNEKYRGIRLELNGPQLMMQAHNPEQEEAEEALEVDYSGGEIEIGFNVNYLLDALAAVEGETVELMVADANSSCLIHAPGNSNSRFVVMPMRL